MFLPPLAKSVAKCFSQKLRGHALNGTMGPWRLIFEKKTDGQGWLAAAGLHEQGHEKVAEDGAARATWRRRGEQTVRMELRSRIWR
uniref:Uncharacterized protein n=1 Tax=Anopheles arabiensis TaxID=7173 RepID=A0A182IF42_ANOAR